MVRDRDRVRVRAVGATCARSPSNHSLLLSSSCLARLVGLLPGVMMRRASTRVMAVRWLSTTHGSARTYQ